MRIDHPQGLKRIKGFGVSGLDLKVMLERKLKDVINDDADSTYRIRIVTNGERAFINTLMNISVIQNLENVF
jgi:hypothetical protein